MTAMEKVKDKWGENAPEFIIVMAQACDKISQAGVARDVGISTTAVNLLLNNRYKAKLDRVERKVRSALMHETVHCPYLDIEITQRDCDTHSQAKITMASPQLFKHRRACLDCANNFQKRSETNVV
ncbi:hypothetical protein [Emcibacter sp.]|uniref:hypothetical protein n=1 Tax=Emcibacter sp. TaxID=1979954 RepID=UPI002AA777E0|nr:hypothetical protein [Emcibacter sp.]